MEWAAAITDDHNNITIARTVSSDSVFVFSFSLFFRFCAKRYSWQQRQLSSARKYSASYHIVLNCMFHFQYSVQIWSPHWTDRRLFNHGRPISRSHPNMQQIWVTSALSFRNKSRLMENGFRFDEHPLWHDSYNATTSLPIFHILLAESCLLTTGR